MNPRCGVDGGICTAFDDRYQENGSGQAFGAAPFFDTHDQSKYFVFFHLFLITSAVESLYCRAHHARLSSTHARLIWV
jgi:hypothetical protein